MHTQAVIDSFIAIGGTFLTQPDVFIAKTQRIRAYLFDWDGVFTNGSKSIDGSSPFSEIDSMGINLLRFGHWLRHEKKYAFTGIMTGEKNLTGFHLAQREHLDAVYFRVKNKGEAFQHLLAAYQLKAEEVAFVFDDVLDLPVARLCGLRLMIRRSSSPLFTAYVKSRQLVDYITGNDIHSVREVCELMLGLQGNFEEVVDKRSHFTDEYAAYFDGRNQIMPSFFTKDKEGIVQTTP